MRGKEVGAREGSNGRGQAKKQGGWRSAFQQRMAISIFDNLILWMWCPCWRKISSTIKQYSSAYQLVHGGNSVSSSHFLQPRLQDCAMEADHSFQCHTLSPNVTNYIQLELWLESIQVPQGRWVQYYFQPLEKHTWTNLRFFPVVSIPVVLIPSLSR